MSTLHPPNHQDGTLDLTIRFSAPLADLLISIANPTSTTSAALKQEIRKHLPDDYSKRRIRLIYSGKALTDDVLVSTALKRSSSHAPSRSSTPIPSEDLGHGSARSRGKAPIRDPPINARVYIHCSIGDVVLDATELAAEATLATNRDSQSSGPIHQGQNGTPTASTLPRPRGFDRLLATGFTPAEVQNLRLQFLAVQQHTHTPDAMPSPNTLRSMEDGWLDNSESGGGANAAPGTQAGSIAEDEGLAGQLDDMIWGATMGFFWPVGCLLWAMREEGVWSWRRKTAVVIGVFVNICMGTARWMTGMR